jgi:hypothetical protein
MGWISKLRRNQDRDRGANLVEFALLAPFLLLLLLGIIEFGFLMGLNNDVRHGAREGARFAAVDGGDETAIMAYICNSMEPLGSGLTAIRVALGQTDNDSPSNGIEIGDSGTLTIEGDMSSLSGLGFIEVFLPTTLTSTIDFRLEQDPSWSPQALTDAGC